MSPSFAFFRFDYRSIAPRKSQRADKLQLKTYLLTISRTGSPVRPFSFLGNFQCQKTQQFILCLVDFCTPYLYSTCSLPAYAPPSPPKKGKNKIRRFQMKKVVYSVSRFNKFGNNKLTGIGFITEKDLICVLIVLRPSTKS